ncbi:MAG: hypothetical protein J0G95_10810 [Rhizobiales bacterium]|nr:hypothetical protein [Hyphomicrobiales bacterium]
MAGPWEQYQQAEASSDAQAQPQGPWAAYQEQKPAETGQKSFLDKLGETTIGHIAKSIYSGVTLPGDVYAGRAHVPGSENAQAIPGAALMGSPDSAGERVADLAQFGVIPSVASGTGRMLAQARGMGNKAVSGVVIPEGIAVGQAANRIGVDLPRAVTSDATAVQQIGKVASAIPVAGTPLRKASQQAIEQLGQKASEVQGALGAGEANAAGIAAREGIERYIGKETADRANALYSKVDELVDPTATRPLAYTQKAAQEIAGRRDLAALGDSPAVSQIAEALSRPEGLTYEGVKQLRSSIGEMLKGGPLPAGLSQSELKNIYGALSKDLEGTVLTAGGRRAAAMFDRANKYYGLVSQRRENLARILKTNSDEAAFDRIASAAGSNSRGDITLLSQAKKAMKPDEWNEVASAVLSRIGRDAEGNFSPDRFVTGWGKLSDAGRGMLFSGEHRAALNDIAKVSSRFKQLNQYANPSGTGQTVAGIAGLGGAWIDPATLLTSVVSGRVLSGILAKPSTAKATADFAKAYEKAAEMPGAAKSRYLGYAAQRFSIMVAKELGQQRLAQPLASAIINYSNQSE